MGEKESLRNRLRTVGRRADWCEKEGRYDEAAGLWADHHRITKRLLEAKRADRVARRRERIKRNFGLYAGDVAITHPDDVAFGLRLAIEMDRAYLPDSHMQFESP